MRTKTSLRAGMVGAGLLVALGLAQLAARSFADEKDEKKAPEATSGAQAALDRLKALAGTWEGTAKGEEPHPVTMSYRVTAGGSAVVETEFVGTEHEMVTVYHLDGKDLVLTHYCAQGNQPHMRAKNPVALERLEFGFDGGTNIDPAKDPHMHSMVLTFVGPDRIKSEWAFYEDGKQGHMGIFELTRKK